MNIPRISIVLIICLCFWKIDLAIGQGIPQKEETKFSLNQKETVTITYLHHSGWFIETSERLMLIDYTPLKGVIEDKAILTELRKARDLGKQLLIFITHEHDDHFYPTILEWVNQLPEIEYVFGWNCQKSLRGRSYKVFDRDSIRIKDLNVFSHRSTDGGSGFLIRLNEVSFYHSGDHALWERNMKTTFEEELKFIANHQPIHVAFLCYPGRSIPNEGSIRALEILKPDLALPMHSDPIEYSEFSNRVYKRFGTIKSLEVKSHLQKIEFRPN